MDLESRIMTRPVNSYELGSRQVVMDVTTINLLLCLFVSKDRERLSQMSDISLIWLWSVLCRRG